MISDREAFDRILAEAAKSARKWTSLSKLEQREFGVELREAIAAELDAAYWEQRSGLANYRLTEGDVLFARRTALWLRFDLALQTWRSDIENEAAETRWTRARQTGPDAESRLSDEVKRRMALRPKPPDTRDPPISRPDPSNTPDDWPPVTGKWSVWIEELIERRRDAAKPKREPGDDEECDASTSGRNVECGPTT